MRQGGGLRILIVGGGVAGLTLAALLRQRGEEPLIVESAPEYGQVGYLVSLWPMGNRVLRGLGLYEGFEELSVPLKAHVILDGSGRVIRASDVGARMAPYGEIRTLERADLVDLLRSHGGGIPVHTETTVAKIEQDPKALDLPAKVTFADGSENEFDLVVGSDGFGSEVRRLLFGEIAPRYTGAVLYWWWEEARAGVEPAVEINDFWGAGKLLGLYSGKKRSARYAMLPSAESTQPSGEVPDDATEAHKQLLQKRLDGLGGKPGREILDRLAGVPYVERLQMADILAPKWHEGRVALVGDAAAAVLSVAGVGAALAMESAAVLADELLRADARYLPNALKLYEERRRKKIERLQNASQQMIRLPLLHNPVLVAARNAALRRLPERVVAGDAGQLLERPI